MSVDKICPYCFCLFPADGPENKVFCSEKCQIRHWNKEHKAERYEKQIEWRKNNPKKVTEYRRKNTYKKYGMTPLDFENLVRKHNGCCAICKTTEPGGLWNSWNIDHDHETNKVRGILCHDCNIALGHFKDDEELLLKAVGYLRDNAGDNK